MYILKYQHSPRSGREHAPRLQSGLLALALLLMTLVGAAFYQIPHAQAAGSGPIIHWDPSMIYPGQNNGNPWGPTGEPAVVHGAGFTAGQQLKLLMVAGNSNQDANACKPVAYAAPYSAIVGQVTVSSSGSFDATFAMPGGLGQATMNVPESICAVKAADNSVVSSRDDGPFTVLTASKPSFAVSASSSAAGGSITVTGQNWAPPQPLSITIANCADCAPTSGVANVTTNSTGHNSGTFNVTIPLPADAQPGNYLVNVSTRNGLLDANRLTGVGVKQLAITAPQVTPTVTATSSPSPSVTQTTTATTKTNTAPPANNTGGGSGPLMFILLAIAVVILAIGGVLVYMYAQRRKEELHAPNNPGSPQPGGGQFQQYNNPQTPFPQSQFGNAPGGAFADYNQNRQGSSGFQNFQQNQSFQPGNAMPGAGRVCARCGSPLAPNAANCVACGMQIAPYDPNATIPY